MKNIRKIMAIVLILLICFTIAPNNVQAASTSNIYTISESYQYPIIPGTSEWSELNTLEERVAACKIPDNILYNLTTEALVESVINYPLIVYMFAYDTTQMGYEKVKSYFTGLQELAIRDDAVEKLQQYLGQQGISVLNKRVAETILDNLTGSQNQDILSTFALMAETHYDYTPNGSRIALIYNMSYADHGTNEAEVSSEDAMYSSLHPNATSYGSINPAYNCHSYAWYNASTSNKYWLNGTYVTSYITDGSYTQVSTPRSGDIVLYEDGDHSGVYNGNGYVTSKWGMCKLYTHALTDCPYTVTGITYWRKN